MDIPHRFLFVIYPPHGGSTLLHEFLSTSPHVSPNNTQNTREGQGIAEARKLMRVPKRWDPNTHIPWDQVKAVWMKHWDLSKKILLDKSTMNVPHTFSIEKAFEPAYFICMVRNPYAYCESLMRRMNFNQDRAAGFSMHALRFQMRNVERLKRVLLIHYEDLTERPEETRDRILNFIPQLEYLEIREDFKAHNFKKQRMGFVNLNPEKIAMLSAEDIAYFTYRFQKPNYKKIMDYFGYKLR